jgi:hypothetical protein
MEVISMAVATARRHFASIAAQTIVLTPGGQPQTATIVQPPFRFRYWPDLNPAGDNATKAVTGYEIPEYLWFGPNGEVQNPVTGETARFQRAIPVGASSTTNRLSIPAGTRRFDLNIAADDFYSFALDRIPANQTTPIPIMTGNQGTGITAPTWRNVKLFESTSITLVAGDTVVLTVDVRNNPRTGGTPENNPAMLTWSMFVF